MCRTERLPTPVASIEAARDHFDCLLANEYYQDNFREAYEDDSATFAEYTRKADSGCCGSADKTYLIEGRIYWIGCNYGH